MGAIEEAYKDQMRSTDFQEMPFESQYNLLVDQGYSRRKSDKLQRLIKQAKFSDPSATVEDIECHA